MNYRQYGAGLANTGVTRRRLARLLKSSSASAQAKRHIQLGYDQHVAGGLDTVLVVRSGIVAGVRKVRRPR